MAFFSAAVALAVELRFSFVVTFSIVVLFPSSLTGALACSMSRLVAFEAFATERTQCHFIIIVVTTLVVIVIQLSPVLVHSHF